MIASDTANEMLVICFTHFMDVYLTKSRKWIRKKRVCVNIANSSRFCAQTKFQTWSFVTVFRKGWLHCIAWCMAFVLVRVIFWCLLPFQWQSMTAMFISHRLHMKICIRHHFSQCLCFVWQIAKKQGQRREKKILLNSMKESVASANKSTLNICTELHSTFIHEKNALWNQKQIVCTTRTQPEWMQNRIKLAKMSR